MKLVIDKKIRIGYLSAFIILVISYFLLFAFGNKMLYHSRLANYFREKHTNLNFLFSSLKNTEKNYQDYLLNRNPEFLQKINDGQLKMDSSLNLIIYLANDSLENKENNNLHRLVTKVISTYNLGLVSFNNSKNTNSDTVKSISHNAGLFTILAQDQIKSMQMACNALSNKDDISANSCLILLKITYFTSLIISVLIALYSLLIYMREKNARQKAEAQTLFYINQLEKNNDLQKSNNQEVGNLNNLEKFAATGRMARMIAHEVRNPLTNIGLANDQLKDAVEANEENLMLINMIKRNGERINQLVGDLLNATKFVELKLNEHAINDLLDEVVCIAKDTVEFKNTTISKNYSSTTCNVLVDADKIKIALLNVLINAIEAIKTDEGKIEIVTSGNNKICIVTIKDNGSGMTKEVIAKLFEPFFSSKSKGNGLGLTNTQNIILNHKGNISVESEVGKGTDFTIQLNCA